MDTSWENRAPAPEAILKLVKDALGGCRESTSRLYGLARGLEIGISTLQASQWTASESIDRLRERSLGLSDFRDSYRLGVALGIDLATKVSLAITNEMSEVSWPQHT
jgi:hypothetical protein